jgi:hypothetical protein
MVRLRLDPGAQTRLLGTVRLLKGPGRQRGAASACQHARLALADGNQHGNQFGFHRFSWMGQVFWSVCWHSSTRKLPL